ncbi:MAG TPA: hypothetical protein VK845_08555 [Gemmatimonadales bacterium]|nr:hypothetical protein [Gemmatimonadales bacterium]
MSATAFGQHTPRSVGLSGERYFLVMSALLLALAVAGFVPSLYLRQWLWPDVFNGQRHGAALPPYLYAHGIALTAWFVIALVQTSLVAVRRTPVHRQVGVFGVCIALAVVITSLSTTAARDAPVLTEQPGRALPQLLTVSTFALCVAAGTLLRRKPALHKRLMLVASLSVVGPAISRLASNLGAKNFSVISAATILTMLASLPVRDLLREGRVHRGTTIGFLLVGLGFCVAFLMTRTALWPGVARLLS